MEKSLNSEYLTKYRIQTLTKYDLMIILNKLNELIFCLFKMFQ